MAGDWIKMRVGLGYDLKVMQLARLLNGDRQFLGALIPDEPIQCGSCNAGMLHTLAIGALHKFWCVAQEVTDDGNLGSTDIDDINCMVGIPGFAESMIEIGWLNELEDGSLQIHNWHEHNGDSAKKRANTKKRVDRHRDMKREGVTACNAQALPEKRREEKRRSNKEKEKKESSDAQSGDCSHTPDRKSEKLDELIDAWNQLPEGIAPRVKERTSKAIQNGWKKVQREPDLKAAFADIPHLMSKIRASTFLRDWNSFVFTWLFKGKESEWNACKILEGRYDDGNQSSQRDPARIRSSAESHELFK